MPYAAVRETLTGVVFLLGDRAYKCKKPVDLGFVDFRDRGSRADCCRREVTLNRRLAPDVYLGVAELIDAGSDGGEPFVIMRRMPDERRLSTMVRAGAPLKDTIIRLARMMAAFHSRADRSPEISAEGSRDAIGRRWIASFEQVAPIARGVLGEAVINEIHHSVNSFLAGREELFDQRLIDGRILDGHGDLICDDIFCLTDGPRVLDCLDFDDRLRYVDGLDDIAFLAMDLEKLGAPHHARLLLHRYADFAGDPAPSSLRHHYVAYRAFVRVKVACLRDLQGDATAATDARAYADIALDHLRAGTVRMIMIGGLPGAGKSTVAGLVADQIGAVLLSTDRTRKELNNPGTDIRNHHLYRRGLYDLDHTRRAYAELLRRARELLSNGESVVLDASWTSAEFRSNAVGIAAGTQAELIQAECWVPPETRRSRLAQRQNSISDADPIIADRMAMDATIWQEAFKLNNVGTPEQTAHELITHLEHLKSSDIPGP
jgi:hypothetical protein